MHAATLILALSSLVGYTLAKAGTCHGQRLYCGSSLKNMGWSTDDIWAGLSKGNQYYPNTLQASQLAGTLFECDGRSGHDALWWRRACEGGGCHDGGAGHSDYCE